MFRNLLLILTSSLLLTFSTSLSIEATEEKPLLTSYFELQRLRSRIPVKSKFETNKAYQQKIDSLKLSIPSLEIKLVPNEGTYDLEKQQLRLAFNTISRYFGDLSQFPQEDKNLAKERLFDDNSSAVVIDYRQDSKTIDKKVACDRGYGKKIEYIHRIYNNHQYTINTLGKDLEQVSLNISPQQAKKYFAEDEKSLNQRLIVKLTLEPVLPFYSFYTTNKYSECPNSYEAIGLANKSGIHTSSYNNNHLIHAYISDLEVIDRFTNKTIYFTSVEKEKQ